MNKYLHRILFKLGFCKKEAKDVLNEALQRGEFYMCGRIVFALYHRLRLKYHFSAHAHYMSAYGFTFKNYKKFIEENYPPLIKYLGKGGYEGPWLGLLHGMNHCDIDLAYESKDKFLKYLIGKL